MTRTLLLAALAMLATGTARAADDCANAQDQTTMDVCASDAFKKSDKQLNGLYKEIGTRLKDDTDKTKLLVAAQRAWVAFRDAECSFSASGVSGGSVYPMIYSLCLDGLTQTRVKDLQTYLACEEGDMSCPVPAAN
ncbi:lysozyme inhibitor LprI family protein [Pararhizobium sp.]|uniref:lysozyme inhibitor LprI family protein n=1 Tax=Pararhizobium sp. TaxID=1977563 RepID=UPI003D10D970